ncbi:MAG: hypothetical protein PF508_21005 [Spirochaeta sp.]|jgi:hypothetical protein|nr:hypothetical protein [Spirochaeta sp.]
MARYSIIARYEVGAVRRLKAKDMSIAEIAAVTDLPEDAIREL